MGYILINSTNLETQKKKTVSRELCYTFIYSDNLYSSFPNDYPGVITGELWQ